MAAVTPIRAEEPGDVLSPSSANQFLGCSFKWAARKILRLPDPPSGARSMGSAVHNAVRANMDQKCDEHIDLPVEGVVGVYRDAWNRLERETEFRDDEDPGELKAQGEQLVRLYMDQEAPRVDPYCVEYQVRGVIGGVPVRGYIDLLDVDGRIIDLKTAARKPSEIGSDHRFQVATYKRLSGLATGAARITTLTKTKVPAIVNQDYTISAADEAAPEKLYPLVQKMIRAGNFSPNRSHFLCSRKYCGFWRACEREFGGVVKGGETT